MIHRTFSLLLLLLASALPAQVGAITQPGFGSFLQDGNSSISGPGHIDAIVTGQADTIYWRITSTSLFPLGATGLPGTVLGNVWPNMIPPELLGIWLMQPSGSDFTHVLVIPDDPSLVGLTLYTQVLRDTWTLQGGPWSFSDTFRVTITS